jgi:hypothetical protein
MSDVGPQIPGHETCKDEGTAHIMGSITLMSWPCGLQLQIGTRLGRVSYYDRMWEIHEEWRRSQTDGN